MIYPKVVLVVLQTDLGSGLLMTSAPLIFQVISNGSNTELLFIYGPSTFYSGMFKTCWVAQPPVLLQFSLLFASLSLAAPMALLWEVINSSYRSLTKTHIFKGSRAHKHTHTRWHRNKHARISTCVTSMPLKSAFQTFSLLRDFKANNSFPTQLRRTHY